MDEGDWKEKRRSHRINLLEDEKLIVHVLSPDSERTGTTLVAQVRNISLRGCRLYFEQQTDYDKIQINQSLVASLAVEDFPIPLQVEVVRKHKGNEVAIRFVPPFPRELERLERFLEPRCLGLSMREIDPSSLQSVGTGKMRWFHGANDTSLFTWIDPGTGAILQHQLVFLDNVVEWRKDQEILTGRIRKDPGEDAGRHFGYVKAELLDFDAFANKVVIEQARVLLRSMRAADDIKGHFLQQLP